jgi:hypothetical protein
VREVAPDAPCHGQVASAPRGHQIKGPRGGGWPESAPRRSEIHGGSGPGVAFQSCRGQGGQGAAKGRQGSCAEQFLGYLAGGGGARSHAREVSASVWRSRGAANLFWGIGLVLQIFSTRDENLGLPKTLHHHTDIHHLLEHCFWLFVPYKSVFLGCWKGPTRKKCCTIQCAARKGDGSEQ